MYNMLWFTINNCLFKNGLLLPEKLAAAMELKPIEIQKSKTSTTFLKRGKYLKNKSFFCFTYVISKFIFSKLKAFPVKPSLKRLSASLAFTFIIYGMYLAIHGKIHTKYWISKFTLLYLMYIRSLIISLGFCYNTSIHGWKVLIFRWFE